MEKMNGSVDLGRPIDFECSSGDHKTLDGVLRGFIAGVTSSDGDGDGDGDGSPALFKRIRKSLAEHAPHLREASSNSVHDLLRWTREGSALRPLLVISVGTITFLALTGLLVFTLFFLTATLSAIIISALVSLAAVGGFLALFFACLTSAYIGALLVAMFVISAATIMMIIAVLVATGWIGFFYVVWLAVKKSMDLTKRSLSITSSAISAYSRVEDN